MRRARKRGPGETVTAGRDHGRTLRGLMPYVWPQGRHDLRMRVVWAFVALIAAKIITVAVPVSYKYAVDGLTGSATGAAVSDLSAMQLASVPVFMIIAYGMGRILMVIFAQIRDVLFTRVALNAVRSLADRTFRHLHDLSLRFHLQRRTGGLSRLIERGVQAIELIIRMAVLNSVPTAFELLLICGLIAYYFGWIYVVIVLVTVVLYVWFTFKASEWRIAIRRDMNESDTEAHSRAVDSLLNYETVKYFNNEDLEARRFDSSMRRYEAASVRAYSSLGILNGGQAVIFTIGMTACMLLAARDVGRGVLTIGDFVMINAILIQLYVPLNFMGMVYREIKQGLVDLEAMFTLLDEPAEVSDAPDAKPLRVTSGAIRFQNVDFAYDPDRQILRDVSFEVPAGKLVAVVGPSGAGKSTLSRILYRFYEITGGSVTIDGQDIRGVTQASLRKVIGMVPQDTVLFNDTIAYNIQYGRNDATEVELREAAALAQIDGFIQTLPLGYETMVGERGLKLSGGEKQRVAIARTVLKQPPILILDEATSALDSYTEQEIQTALDRVSQGRTTLVIAHRLSTIVNADEILVMEQGQIVERGSHAALLAADGVYAAMWNRQREAASVVPEDRRPELGDAGREKRDSPAFNEPVSAE